MGNHPPADIDPAVRRLIRHKVRHLVGRYGFTATDRDDLEQELVLRVHVAKDKYNLKRGSPSTFLGAVVTNNVNRILEHAKAKKRDFRRIRSIRDIDDVAQTPDNIPLLHQKLDVEQALTSLSPDQRPVASLFMTETPANVMRITGMTRGKMRSACSQIAQHFAAQGWQK